MWLHGQAVKTPPFHGGNRGSIPRGVTIFLFLEYFARLAELADAPDLGSGGRPWGFKSLIAHHEREYRKVRFFVICADSENFVLQNSTENLQINTKI